ncbi:MAG: hypothetical protein JSU04_06120 [Bdellovibrionales bacterium]|nr:hypothetical protein [Bdellovibrionales bacterium]
MEITNEQQPIQEEIEFSTEIFNVTNEPDDFSIILTNTSDFVGMEMGGRRC